MTFVNTRWNFNQVLKGGNCLLIRDMEFPLPEAYALLKKFIVVLSMPLKGGKQVKAEKF